MKRNDKSRYNGCPMNIYGAIMPGTASLARIPVGLSKQARQRIKWFDYYHRCQNISLTCRYYGISRKTFYKWKRRYLKYHLPSLENNSRRPRHLRQSKIPWEQVLVVKKLRTQYPYYSKYKVSVILKRDHSINLSASTVGRIIKKYNLFFKSPYRRKKERYASVNRKKLSKDYPIKAPGDLIESDMKHIPFLGQKRYCFVAVDCVGKAIAVKISSTSSSGQNSLIIEQIKQTFPFPIKSWRNDNGSENLKDFHQALEEAGISQYFTHPSCPKDKPFVERVIGTIEREFIQQGKLACDVETQQKLINEWLDEYHNYRPHQALGYLTPNEYYKMTIGKTIKQLLPMY
jgi:transposase InsO family protein